MKEINTESLLMQLRANAALAQNKSINAREIGDGAAGANFSLLLKQSIDKVNDLQNTSDNLAITFEQGDPRVSLAQVMIAKEKSSIAFQSVLQVRNKLLEAYKEIMSMQV